MSENLKTRSLSRQLIVTIILFSSLITLILTTIQLYLEYHRDTDAIDARLQQVESSYQRSIENAIWDLDKKQIQVQIDGIHELPDIEYAEITSDSGLFLSSGTRIQSKKTKVRQYDLSHTQEEMNYPLGVLTVVANLESAYDRLLNRLGTVLLSNALKTFLVALFITFLLKRKVIRHVENVSTFLSQLGANKLDQQFNLNRKKSQNGQRDELDILENSVNQLRSNLAHSLSDIQAAEKRYRWLLRNSDEFIYRIGFKKPIPVNLPVNDQIQLILEHGFAAEWNDALNNKLGYADDQLAKMKINDLHPLFDKDNLQSMQHFIESGYRINDSEVHVPDINGKIFTVLMNLSGVVENNHLVYIWGQDTDITERLKAQQKLQNSEDRLIAAQRIAHIGYWDHDIYKDQTVWSDESYRIYGYEPQSFIPDTKFFQSILHPDDRDQVMAAFDAALKEPAAMEFRIIRPDGTQRTISGTSQVTNTNKGKPVQLFGVIQDITENKEKEREAQESDARLAYAQEVAHVGHWEYNKETKITTWSDELFRIFAHEPQSFIPTMKSFGSMVHPDDRRKAILIGRNITGTPVRNELRIIRQDGVERITSGTLWSIQKEGQPEQVFGVVQDITELKEEERKVQESEARLAEAQQIAHVGNWEYDPETRVVNWSDEFFRILGYEPQSFTPSFRRFSKRIHPDDRDPAILEARGAINAPVTNEYRIIRPDGTHRNVSNTLWVTKKNNGELERTFGIIQDITERKQLEQKSRDQQLLLIQTDKMSSLGLLVSGVAHEINNPNNLIKINASMLEEMWRDIKPVLDKYQVENSSFLIGGLPYQDAIESVLDMITGQADASQRIERIIDDLKNFARRSDNQNIVEISVNEAIESAARLLKPLIKSKTDYLQLDLADDLPSIEGNLQHVEQIVINLLSNALDALPDKKHKVWISSLFDDKSQHIQIRIKDNGVGIPNSDLKKIFDPFFTTKQETGGTGLGLAIAYNLTKEHGGHLSCFSMKDEGTIFTISFPIAND